MTTPLPRTITDGLAVASVAENAYYAQIRLAIQKHLIDYGAFVDAAQDTRGAFIVLMNGPLLLPLLPEPSGDLYCPASSNVPFRTRDILTACSFPGYTAGVADCVSRYNTANQVCILYCFRNYQVIVPLVLTVPPTSHKLQG